MSNSNDEQNKFVPRLKQIDVAYSIRAVSTYSNQTMANSIFLVPGLTQIKYQSESSFMVNFTKGTMWQKCKWVFNYRIITNKKLEFLKTNAM